MHAWCFCFLFWHPAFLLYTASTIAVAFFLILYCAPRFGQTNILVYIGICSIIGSLTVSGSSFYPIHLWSTYSWLNSIPEVIFCFALLIEYLVSQVMSIKAIGIAIRLTIEGADQFVQFQTWIFTMVAISCIITQLNYLNMVCITLNFYVSIMFCIWKKRN